jgi:hypothetical protein
VNGVSGFAEIEVECEEGHIYYRHADLGRYFTTRELKRVMNAILHNKMVCDECGRPLFSVKVRREKT